MQPEQLGPYRIVGRLGRGGMGTVYEGVNTETDEPAAIKVLGRELGREEDFRHRFASEIETLRRLKHPNIVRLFGFGEQDDQLFYVMELVDGVSLEEEINAGRRFEWRTVARIGVETCRALRHAHDRGVIHRDIKPANLLLASDGTTKLSDFGIARLFGSTRMTTAGSVIGTVEYMSPEQAEGRPVDYRADLYSLAGVMYALLAGRPPFVAKTLPEMLHKQRYAVPDPVNSFVKDVPEKLSNIIDKLLAKAPADRFPNAMVLGRHLESLLSIGPAQDGVNSKQGSVSSNGQSTDGGKKYDDIGFELKPPSSMPAGGDPSSLAVTRDIGDSDPSLYISGKPADESLPETRATDAFGVFGSPPKQVSAKPHGRQAEMAAGRKEPENKGPIKAESSGKESPKTEALGKTITKGRFTVVSHEELDHVAPRVEERHALISAQTWVLAAALIIAGMGAWYALHPPSADALYDKIVEQTADGKTSSILKAKEDIEEFLLNHADDPRCKSLRKFEREIRLDELRKKVDLRAMVFGDTKDLLPIERAYFEAKNIADRDPEKGMKKLQALVDLYGHNADISGHTGQCLELIHRKLDMLREEIEKNSPDHLAMINERLNRADDWFKTEPEESIAIWKGVIELYSQKPWAAEAVRRAEKALAKAEKAPRKGEATAESKVEKKSKPDEAQQELRPPQKELRTSGKEEQPPKKRNE
ncbi:MAG: protein kinase [Pirellulales bacterium]|nr:protein kinase [Pirellulales bacterium]